MNTPFSRDFLNRETAYQNLLGADYDIKHMNRIEEIWATTLDSRAAIEKYLIKQKLLPANEIRKKVLRFWYDKQGLVYNG